MQFRFQNVCLETIAYTLPEEVVTSEEIEQRLASVYQRLRLPEGRLELMSGIHERRLFPPGTRPSEKSILSGEKAIGQSGIDRQKIGALIHGSVCRDFLEPATAAGVHHGLGLSSDCVVYDLSNACLGLLNGTVQIASMIELGQIEAGMVVGTEDSRELLERTIDLLLNDPSLTRQNIKPAFASLTIGSGSAAILLTHRDLSRSGHRLLGGVSTASTDHCDLCQSDGMEAVMETDSETLLKEGVSAAKRTFTEFCDSLGWTPDRIDKTFCHQVGRAHRKLLLEELGLSLDRDYVTFDRFGNTGSVALPMGAGVGWEDGFVNAGDRVAMLGIGSGINVMMLGVEA
ncbi:MAG: 3-oxoacyl-ACP synthase III [Planctomycetia bacterium]|jgi:3-oxoacyl-[acyl-carrier-protein] synthase-3